MKERKEKKIEEEKQEHIQREKIRRSTGRDMGAARAKMEEIEMRKVIDERKREKEQDRLAKYVLKMSVYNKYHHFNSLIE